jgi:predicted dehydrogenase
MALSYVNLGIIGAGKWVHQAYLPILREMPEVRLRGIVARSQASRDRVGAEVGSGPILYPAIEDLLKDPQVHAVAIALPNDLHDTAIEAAARAGKHIFFEPPLGLTSDRVRRSLHALPAAGRVAQADLELRCLPVMDLVRTCLHEGTIGEPLMATVRLWCDWGFGGGDWAGEVQDQSFFLWLGCWYLDLLDWVFEVAPVQASVVGGYAMNGRMMDHGQAVLEFPGQRAGGFEFSLVATEGTRISLHVAGTNGELEADLLAGVCRTRRGKRSWQEVSRPCTTPIHGFAGMRECLADFIHAVLDGTQPRADLEACRRIHEAALACARAEQERRTVPVVPLSP